jgi:hypothetical protein
MKNQITVKKREELWKEDKERDDKLKRNEQVGVVVRL